jgi:LysM domain-containing protein
MTSAAVAMSGRGRPVEDRRQNRAAVRLTRRGRAVAVLCVLALAVALGLLLRQPSSEAGAETRPHAAYEYVVVAPGETLWQIAERVAPDVDPRVTIMRIQDLNGLPDAAVAAGQRIALPPHG